MQSFRQPSNFVLGTILGAIIVATLTAVFNPLFERLYDRIFRESLRVSASEPTRIPVALDETLSCLIGISAIVDELNNQDKFSGLYIEGGTITLSGALIRQCQETVSLRNDDGYVVRNVTIENQTSKEAENVTFFSSDDLFIIKLNINKTITVVEDLKINKGYNLGNMPPNTSTVLLIGGNIYSDMFVESSFGQEIIYEDSFMQRWRFFIFISMMVLAVLLFVIAGTLSRLNSEP